MVTFAADADAAAHVFLPAIDEDELVVDGPDGHHLQRVRRLGVGEQITVADGAGRWRTCTVSSTTPGVLRLTAAGAVEMEPARSPRIAIAFAPAKAATVETVVAELTELGADRILPVTTARSVVRWEGDRAARAAGRLQRVAREAAQQSRRARIPDVVAPGALHDLSGHPDVILADRSGGSAAAVPAPSGGEWLVIVGPEGGLDPAELGDLSRAARLGLGPFVLRAATAPAAALAVLSQRRKTVQDGASGPEGSRGAREEVDKR